MGSFTLFSNRSIMLDKNLKIAVIEYDIVWGDKEANLSIVGNAMSAMPTDTDIVVLPEMFSTGFITGSYEEAKELAERNTQDTIHALHRLAASHNVAIAGSFLAHTASQLYNRAFFIEPNGDDTFYDKRHLFRMGGESDIYSRGVTFAHVVRFRGWNIKIAVCYDLRFPVWCRNRFDGKDAYDLLVVVANWPKARHHPWNILLASRAIENESYVCGANRSGVDPNGVDYASSSSALYNFKGKACIPQSIPIEKGNVLYYRLERGELERFRTKFPAWMDADPFTLSL